MDKSKPKVTIASLVYSMIAEGKNDDAIIKAIKKKFPESKINKSHMNWYRSQVESKDKPKKEVVKKEKASSVKEPKEAEVEDEEDVDDDEDEDENEKEDDK